MNHKAESIICVLRTMAALDWRSRQQKLNNVSSHRRREWTFARVHSDVSPKSLLIVTSPLQWGGNTKVHFTEQHQRRLSTWRRHRTRTPPDVSQQESVPT